MEVYEAMDLLEEEVPTMDCNPHRHHHRHTTEVVDWGHEVGHEVGHEAGHEVGHVRRGRECGVR